MRSATACVGSLFLCSAALSACSSDPGAIDLDVTWQAGPAPIATALYIEARVEDADGAVLHRIDPTLFTQMGTTLDFGTVENGPSLVVTIELRDGRWKNSLVLYRGVSARFDLAPNEIRTVDVFMRRVEEESERATTSLPNLELITQARAPWGYVGKDDLPFEAVVGEPGAVDGSALVVVYDGADAALATELSRGSAHSDGSFSIELLGETAAAARPVFVAAADDADRLTDAAPERGLQTAEVTRVRWTARPALEGPFTGFSTTRIRRTRLPAPGAMHAVPATKAAGLLNDDSMAVNSTAKPYFINIQRSEDTFRFGHAAMAGVPTTGEIHMFGGGVDLEGSGTWSVNGSWVLSEGTWRSIQPANAPAARRDHAMVFDRLNGRLIMYGGRFDDDTPSPEMFERVSNADGSFTTSDWQVVAESPPPGARYGHAMAYAANAGVTLLFGGKDAAGEWVDTTWVWDGQSWATFEQGQPPDALQYPRATYDEARGRIVMLGLNLGGQMKTYEWTMAGWVDATPAGSPSARIGHILQHDPARERTVMFGGRPLTSIDFLDDVWIWNGTNWQEQTTSEGPHHAPVAFAQSAYDYISDRVVIYSGRSEPNDHAEETSLLAGDRWATVRSQYDSSPSIASTHAASAYVPSRGSILVTTTFEGGQGLTFEKMGHNWTFFGPSDLVLSSSSALAYSPELDGVVHYGGIPKAENVPIAETSTETHAWYFGPLNWWLLDSPDNPGQRFDAAMVHHESIGDVVLFGGADVDETGWRLDRLGRWHPLDDGPAPPARYEHRLAYDSGSDEAVLYGGRDFTGMAIGDQWALTDSGWTELPLREPTPGPRARHGLAYDAARGTTVLFGGFDGTGANNDVWEFRNSTWWRQDVESPVPGQRTGHMFIYQPGCQCIEVFGGRGDVDQNLTDIWEYWHPLDLVPEVRLVLDVPQSGLSRIDRVRVQAVFAATAYDDVDGPRSASAVILAWNIRNARWVPLGESATEPTLSDYVLPEPATDFVDRLGELHLRFTAAPGDGTAKKPSMVSVNAVSVDVEQALEIAE